MWQHGGETPKFPGGDQPGFQTGAFLIVHYLGDVQDACQLLRQDRTHQHFNPRIRTLPRTDIIPFPPRRTANTPPDDRGGYHCQLYCLSRSFSLFFSAEESEGFSRSDAPGCRRRRRQCFAIRMLTGCARFQGSLDGGIEQKGVHFSTGGQVGVGSSCLGCSLLCSPRIA